MSEDEYTHQNYWRKKVKWCSAKDLLPNPKLYKETGKVKSEILWFTTEDEKVTENNKNRV